MRPRLQFGLRTLLIGTAAVALLCSYVVQQESIVKERRAWIESHPYHALPDDLYVALKDQFRGKNPPSVGVVRRWLGDEPRWFLYVKQGDEDTATRLFPEATVVTARVAVGCHFGSSTE